MNRPKRYDLEMFLLVRIVDSLQLSIEKVHTFVSGVKDTFRVLEPNALKVARMYLRRERQRTPQTYPIIIRNMVKNKYYNIKIQSVFKGKTSNTLLQLFRYTFVGGFAFLVDFCTLFVMTEYFNIHYLVSAGIAFILGLIVNYFLSVRWVFNLRSMGNRLFEFLLFALVGLVGLGLNELFLWILTDIFVIYYLLSKIITTFIVYFWNFFARKLLLFNK